MCTTASSGAAVVAAAAMVEDRTPSRASDCRSTEGGASRERERCTRSNVDEARETQGLASQPRGGSVATGIPRASAPPPGWSVARMASWLAGYSTTHLCSDSSSLALSRAQTPQKTIAPPRGFRSFLSFVQPFFIGTRYSRDFKC
jgi:hypothetical protein